MRVIEMKYRYVVPVLIGFALINVFLLISTRLSESVWLQRTQDIHMAFQVNDRYDVVISAYMRGGSTLAGQILGYHSDSFYVYEPFWKMAPWVYWKGNDTVCRSDRTECRKSSAAEYPDTMFMTNSSLRNTTSLNQARKILSETYDCRFKNFESLVLHPFIAESSGPLWASVKSCLARNEQNVSCVNQNITNKCKNAKHRVTKVLRLTLDHFDTLLKSRNNLKVIHLFRDPRAIMNSRLQAEWYPSKDLLSNADALCRKMLFDYRVGQKLLKKYPNRFRFLYYEDLTDELLDKLKTLYTYIGMPLEEPRYSIVKTTNVFDSSKTKVLTEREKNTAFWWRKKLKWDLVTKMDNLCKDVYDALGYITFSNYNEMQNLTYPSVNIPPEYALIR